MDVKDKTIIITGAARIGQSVAAALGGRGANLALTYRRSKTQVDRICRECGERGVKAVSIQADLSNAQAVYSLVETVKAEFGRIDGLVHMASGYPKTPWSTLSERDWDENMDVIAKSTFLLGKTLGDEMLKNPGENVVSDGAVIGTVKGKIITVSDWSVLTRPYKNYLPYNAAKAAVNALTLSLAKELAPHILVNAVAPGPILPPPDLTEEEKREALSGTPLNRWGGPEEMAKAVLYLFDADFVTGHVLPVDGGRTVG